tara:strand:+ start:2491 stop:3381 length:891 start_codon:yes stop_codon:yes gene_type:complete
MKKKEVLIIGGSGFVGSHVADKLYDNKYNVTIYDIKKSEWIKKKFKFIKGDIQNVKLVSKVIKQKDIVYNFAAIADLVEAQKNLEETYKINFLSNIKILELCKINKVKRYVFASTLYVFSNKGGFYRSSKEAAESFLIEYAKINKISYTILRYGSLYGPRSDKDNNIYNILNYALKNKKIIYQGNPESLREYIHVEDAARISVDILKPEYKNKSLILSGIENKKVSDLLNMIREILDLPKNSITFKNENYAGRYTYTPYSLKEDLAEKIVPKTHIDLGQGILNTIKYIRSKKNNLT